MPNHTHTYLIAAPSARVYALNAVALGHRVIALDAFADQETRALAQCCYVVKTQGDGSLDVADFKRVFSKLASSLNVSQMDGFLYGSWFDAAPELLDWVAEQMPVIGNAADVLRAVKAFDFFAVLDTLGILHPEVCLHLPENNAHWLAKKLSGSGGLHITRGGQGDYYQQEIIGTPVSLLFAADGKTCQPIGFNQQFVSSTPNFPYRYAGGVGNVQLPTNIAQQFLSAAQKLTMHYGLRGINSLDAMLAGDALYILELNPRLSASFAFYPNLLPSLLDVHLQACAGHLMAPQANTGAVAQRIVYAEKALEIAPDFSWSAWVADIPVAENAGEGVKISQNAPICSVRAEAKSAEAAQNLALQRVKRLKTELYGE